MAAWFRSTFNSLPSFLPAIFNPPPAPTQSISAATAPPSELESRVSAANNTPSQFDRPNDGISDWKRIGKSVHTVGLGGLSASLTLMVNAPSFTATHRALYITYFTVVCLSITTSIGLSIFSILFKGSPSVGWIQRMLICLTFFFVVSSCFLHLQFVLLLTDISIVTTLVLIGMIFILLYMLKGSWYQYVSDSEPRETIPV